MPVVITTPEEVETWLTAPYEEAIKLQRPLSDNLTRTVPAPIPVEDVGLRATRDRDHFSNR